MTMAAEIKNRMQTVPATPGIGSTKIDIGKPTQTKQSGGCC